MPVTNQSPEENNVFTYAYMREMPGRINWHLNDLCNFRCEYCFFPYFNVENPVVGKLSPTEIVEAFDRTGRQWHVYMAGGEPMLYPDFIELVALLKPKHPIYVSTNLFNKYTRAFAEKITPENIISINASLHIGHHTASTLQKFIDNYHLYKNKGFNIIVTYVTYPPLFQRMDADFDFLMKKGIEHLHALTFQGMYEGKQYPASYTHDQVKLIRKHSIDKTEMLVTLDKTNFHNRLCRAGKDYFFMDITGNMYRCGTLEGKISYGNLFKGTFKPGSEVLPCPVCKCNDSSQGITSLTDMPAIPDVPSDFSNHLSIKFRQIKNIFVGTTNDIAG